MVAADQLLHLLEASEWIDLLSCRQPSDSLTPRVLRLDELEAADGEEDEEGMRTHTKSLPSRPISRIHLLNYCASLQTSTYV